MSISLARASVVALLPLTALLVACGPASPPASAPSDRPAASAAPTAAATSAEPTRSVPPECAGIEAEVVRSGLNAPDDKDKSPIDKVTALAIALEKATAGIKGLTITTPAVKSATDEFVAAAARFSQSARETAAALKEMDQELALIQTWQKNVGQVTDDFKALCKPPKASADCKAMAGEMMSVPEVKKGHFAESATEMEAFAKRLEALKLKDAKVKASAAALAKEMRSVATPLRKLEALAAVPDKMAADGKAFNDKVEGMKAVCGRKE